MTVLECAIRPLHEPGGGFTAAIVKLRHPFESPVERPDRSILRGGCEPPLPAMEGARQHRYRLPPVLFRSEW